MATLRELQKRLESAETIKQLAGAMRSASTAKYTRLCAALNSYSPYAAALREAARLAREGASPVAAKSAGERPALNKARQEAISPDAPGGADGDGVSAPALCILVSGNRGLCGGYHQQLFSFFAQSVNQGETIVAAAGKKALEYCRSKKIPVKESFALSDVPTFDEAKQIAAYALERFSAGEASEVFICAQRFYNMLRSEPRNAVILRAAKSDAEADDGGAIFIPDRHSISSALEQSVLASDVYDLLLSAATGAQSSTLVAMRSAYDNANQSISSLEIRINRLRQAAVTASVLETSTDVKE